VGDTNVDLVRECYAAYGRRDADALFRRLSSDVAWMPTVGPAGPPRSYRGHDGVHAFFAYLEERWETWNIRLESLQDLGDSVLVQGSVEARDRRGEPLRFMGSWIWRVRDGLVESMQGFPHMGDALTAEAAPAGLSASG
jgi:ketosteroid isomerase-like protein